MATQYTEEFKNDAAVVYKNCRFLPDVKNVFNQIAA